MNREYMYFGVRDGLIYTGNEYKLDARDAIKDLPGGGKDVKILSRRYLKGQGIDPDKRANWADMKESMALGRLPSALRKSPRDCQQFLYCDNKAAGYTEHLILGQVPSCKRCADRLETTLHAFPKRRCPPGRKSNGRACVRQ